MGASEAPPRTQFFGLYVVSCSISDIFEAKTCVELKIMCPTNQLILGEEFPACSHSFFKSGIVLLHLA